MFKHSKNIKTVGGISLRAVFMFIALLSMPSIASAQCAMCRAALQNSESGIQAEAVNDGIVYLMVIPYILVALIGFAIYKSRIKKTE